MEKMSMIYKNRIVKMLFAGLLAVVLCFNLAACGISQAGNESKEQDSAMQETATETEVFDGTFDGEVVVGRVVPLTGPLETFGSGTPYVEQYAIDCINANGGVIIDGKRCSLRLEIKDSGSSFDGAAEAARVLIDEGVDIMIVSNTDDTVSPVSTVCEREGVVCISVDAPASAWALSGPYNNSWHAFFDNEREMLCFYEAWESIDTNKTIGIMTANDTEGIEVNTFFHNFAASKGYRVVDVGSYYVGEQDFSEYIDAYKEADCDIIIGVMVNSDFVRFWTQLRESDYCPKMCTIAKGSLFQNDVENMGEYGDGLICEVWWDDSFPYSSSINGMSSSELAEDYLTNCEQELDEAPATVGYKHANVEILYDILKRAGTLDRDVLNEAARTTDLDTIIGHVHYNEEHISVMSLVTGQWILDENGSYHREIVGNDLIPNVPITAEVKVLE